MVSVPPASYRGPVPRPHAVFAPTCSRRSVLLGTAAAAITLAACTDQPAGTALPRAESPGADELLRRELVAAEAGLVALYSATRAAHPQLADVLTAFEDRHRRHFAALASSGRVAGATRAATPPPTATTAPVSADPAAALAAVRVAEEAAAKARLQDCLRCEDPALAELVAAIAAGEAANGVVLPSAS
jgi:hypothetical protein